MNLIQTFLSKTPATAKKVQVVALTALIICAKFSAVIPVAIAPYLFGGLVGVALSCQFLTEVAGNLDHEGIAAAALGLIKSIPGEINDFKDDISQAISSHGAQLGTLTDAVNALTAPVKQASPQTTTETTGTANPAITI